MTTVPYIFANNNGNIPLAQLDADFANVKAFANTAGYVTANTQGNITAVGTLTTLSVTGNVLMTGRSTFSGNLSATGNAILANARIANASVTGTVTGGNISTTGSITAGNIVTNGEVFAGTLGVGANAYIAGNVLIDELISVAGNIITGEQISAAGNINTNGFLYAGDMAVGGIALVAGNATVGNLSTSGTAVIGGFNINGNTIVSSGSIITIDPNNSGGVDGEVIIQGNLTVNGNMTYINSNNVTTNDLTINMANNASTASLANGGGIQVGPAGSQYISLTYNSSSNVWVATNGLNVQGPVSASGTVTGGNLSISGTGSVTGVLNAPTAANGTNNTQVATTSFVSSAVYNATAALGTLSTQNSNNVSITGGNITGANISSLSSPLPVASGGTGANTLTSNSVLLGNGGSAVQAVTPGTSGNVLKSNGTTWVSQAIRGLGFGGETWQNVTSSRASGTTYTNNLGYPIAVSARSTGASSPSITIVVNGVTVSNFNWQFNGAGAFAGGFTIVPPGATYSLTFNGAGIDFWVELY